MIGAHSRADREDYRVSRVMGSWLIALAFVALFPGLEWLSTPGSSRAAETGQPISVGVHTEWGGNLPDVDNFAALVGGMPGIVMWYQDWSDPSWGCLASATTLNAVAGRGAVPMITWEPWIDTQGINQPTFALRTIVAGSHDEYIQRCAQEAAAWGGNLLLRFGHEMNGDWTPWSAGVNGNTEGEYIAAWQRIVSIFRQEGAANVQWVWSPNVDYGGAPFTGLYPGDNWVDWVALDGYNWGPLKGGGAAGWMSASTIFGESYDLLTSMTAKPLMFAEIGSTEVGGDKSAWIRALIRDLPTRMPRVRAVIWFNQDKETDWRVNSSDSALEAFRELVASPFYGGSGSNIVSPKAPAVATTIPPASSPRRSAATHAAN